MRVVDVASTLPPSSPGHCAHVGYVSDRLARAMPPKGAAPPAPQPTETGPFWFTVRYGVDQTQLFNMDCWAVVLCDHIKLKCGYSDIPEQVDLLKEDNSLVGLSKVGKSYASAVLTSKAKYCLCKLVQPEDGSNPTPQSLWTPAPSAEEEPPAVAEPPKGPPPKKGR
uniref:Uncharacterized protein n=1 Tax=Coccolithus braarudii TaxID=221442 RepID=A0A7S0LJW8_9EUKA